MPQCQYQRQDGSLCKRECNEGQLLCFWHDKDADKTTADIKDRLEAIGNEGEPLEGFVLRRANLSGLRFRRTSPQQRINMQKIDAYRADLSQAHLFNVDLRGSSLIKANLAGANLNCARLNNADLLGCQLHQSKLESTEWGNNIRQEIKATQAKRNKQTKEATQWYIEAEEVYRALHRECEKRKLFKPASRFFLKEMLVHHQQLKRFSREWWWSTIVNATCGYGERPERVVLFSLSLIVLFAFGYFAAGLNGPNGLIAYQPSATLSENLQHFIDCIYFSVVTFTTLGYGDLSPSLSARGLAGLEAFSGAFIMALFVVVFVRKIIR